MRVKRSLVLDDMDIKILDQLKQEGRVPFSTIAQRVKISEWTARQRLYRLQNLGALQVVPKLDHRVLGRERAHLGICLHGPGASKALAEVGRLPEITFLCETTGTYDALAELTTRDAAHLIDIVNTLIRPIDGIASVDALRHVRTRKDKWTFSALAPRAESRTASER